jgi:hypothetical protein
LQLAKNSSQPLKPTEISLGGRSNRLNRPRRIRTGVRRPLTKFKALGLLVPQRRMRAGIPILFLGNPLRAYRRIPCHRPRSLRERRLSRVRAVLRTSLGHLSLRRTPLRRPHRSGLIPKLETLESRSLLLHPAHLFALLRGLISQLRLVLLRHRLITNHLVPPILLLPQNQDR